MANEINRKKQTKKWALESLQNEKYNKSVSNDNTQLIANLNKKSWGSHASSEKFDALLVFEGTFLLESCSSDDGYPHELFLL